MAGRMQDQLTREIEAATRDLLNFGTRASAASSGRHPQSIELPSRSNYSPQAQLELLDSPTEIRPPDWPTPKAKRPASQSICTRSNVLPPARRISDDDQDGDMLPAHGLSARTDPVNVGRSHLSPSFRTNLDLYPGDTSQQVPPNATVGTTSKLRLAAPLDDIYINEYGERVVNGKVVGKTIGGRPRSTHVSESCDEMSVPPTAVFDNQRVDIGKSPPSFFLESFPESSAPALATANTGSPVTLQAPQAVTRALLLAPTNDPDVPKAENEQEQSDLSDDDVSSGQISPSFDEAIQSFIAVNLDTPLEENSCKYKQLDNTSAVLGPAMMRQGSATLQLDRGEPNNVILHGNKRQATKSHFTDSTSIDARGERSGSPFLLPILSKRVDKLFNTPFVHRGAAIAEPASPEAVDSRIEQENLGNDNLQLRHANSQEPSAESGSQESNNKADDASLNSSPSSLISLSVSHVPSHTSGSSSLDRRSSTDANRSRRRSRRSDPSDYPEDNFARDVRIRGWNEVGSQARGWVVFEILILTRQGTPMTVFKRFSSFVKLRQQLASECPGHLKWLPALPSKTAGLLNKYNAKHLEARRKDLQKWLEIVVLDKVWGCSECLRDWVLGSE